MMFHYTLLKNINIRTLQRGLFFTYCMLPCLRLIHVGVIQLFCSHFLIKIYFEIFS